MKRKILFLALLGAVLAVNPAAPGAVLASEATAFLCDFGVAFYRMGRYDDAVSEFKKVLLLEPDNQTAQEYLNKIMGRGGPAVEVPSRQEAMEASFAQLASGGGSYPAQPWPTEEYRDKDKGEKEKKEGKKGLKVTGQIQLGMGASPQDTIWKQANFDLNEENWRTLSDNAYDRRNNTYDTRVFDRFRVNLDGENKEGFGLHTNITVDPWSFTGKSHTFTIKGAGGDSAEIEVKYWSNTGYTFNQSVYTLLRGDVFSFPETKVSSNKINPLRITSVNTNIFNIPETTIHRDFQPFRELWFDYKQEGTQLRFFPIAYQDQALTSDDPLKLSNNHIYWEESPWLTNWKPGNNNTGVGDFTKGKWDDTYAFNTRDSDGTRLSALRGASLSLAPSDDTSFSATVAAPKHLWQEYAKADNVSAAARLKHRVDDNLALGGTYTFRIGLNPNESYRKDITNNVIGVDLGYEVTEGVKALAQVGQSFTKRDISFSDDDYDTKSRGWTYYFSLIGRYPRQSIMDISNGYDGIKPDKTEKFFTKFRLLAARMDQGFDPALASYRETRDDAFWSRHISFRKPFEYYYAGLYYPATTWDDIQAFRLGNGIDTGRSVLGLRLETSVEDGKIYNLFDVRNVHNANGKFIENVARDEAICKITDQVTVKGLGIYQKMPKTHSGFDPFITDAQTGDYLHNSYILNGKDASLKTGSLGLEYSPLDWLAVNGVWERTNDYTMAYDNFPRGNLTSSAFYTHGEYGKTYRTLESSLYAQDLFPLPPYPYYNIFKAGLRLTPIEKLDIYLDYARNDFKSAGQIDENMNHVGIEASYLPTKKLGLYFRYTYSRWNDLTRMRAGYDKYYLGHHNVFGEVRYAPFKEDELILQYGESGRSNIATTTYDPFGSSLLTLDTRHIVRIFYRRKF
jgi:tetratricopeptide (TPR) repeat protein